MDKPQKLILTSLILVSIASWATSQIFEQDMIFAMGRTENVVALSIFISMWTIGMAAMMFPAIVPMVLLYNRMVNSNNGEGMSQTQVSVDSPARKTYSIKVLLFVSCYLVVWALTGTGLLFGWSEIMRLSMASFGQSIHYVFGTVLVISGLYQFTPLKTKCLGYCESPLSFFMKRWSSGTGGAIKMGFFHGLYCLGCCWPYFLLMLALGWMNLFWMVLFAAIIFGEKIWSRGIWVARIAGVGFVVAGVLVVAGAIQIDPMLGNMDIEPMQSDDSMNAMLLLHGKHDLA